MAIDGSDQDRTAVERAAEVAPALRAGVHVTMGATGEVGDAERAAVESVVAQLKERGLKAASVFEKADEPAKQILAAKRAVDAGIVIVPAPYLQNYGRLGDESLSSTIDMLLAESRVPILLVREPLEQPALCLQRFVLPMTIYAPALGAAAGWAFSLARRNSVIELHAVADMKAIEEAKRMAGEEANTETLSAV